MADERRLYERKQVVVRIWTSVANPTNPGANVGHVSIETPGEHGKYMSLWPRQAHHPGEQPAKEREGSGVFAAISHEFVPGLKRDYEYEGRPPEIVYCFYSLDPDAIEKAFHRKS